MITGREIDSKTSAPDKSRLKIKRKYERKFLRTALMLCLYQIKYKILSGAANFIFSGKSQKTTKILRFANREISKNICKCQIMADRCEDYMEKIARIKA